MKHILINTVFALPLKIDSLDRVRNLKLTLNYLLENIDATFVIAEYDTKPQLLKYWDKKWNTKVEYIFIKSNTSYFWKSKVVNTVYKTFPSKVFCLYDVDVVIKPEQLFAAFRKVVEEGYDFVLPYENNVMWINQQDVDTYQRLTPRIIDSWEYETSIERGDFDWTGLCNFFKSEAFQTCGMFNEHMKSWGYEDTELYERMKKLGYRQTRVDGLAYHLEHHRGPDSWFHNDFYLKNKEEYEAIKDLSKEELMKYIQGFEWL